MDTDSLEEEDEDDNYDYQPPLPGQSEAEQLIQDQLAGII